MAETVLDSAHEHCSQDAACGQGSGPCVVYLQAQAARLEEKLAQHHKPVWHFYKTCPICLEDLREEKGSD